MRQIAISNGAISKMKMSREHMRSLQEMVTLNDDSVPVDGP